MAVNDEDVSRMQVTHNRVRELRRSLRPDLSHECARLVDVTKGTWQRIESTFAVPNALPARRIAALFDTTVEKVFIASVVRTPTKKHTVPAKPPTRSHTTR
jgi:DNA-binding XRE family transcriptional regulator